MLKKINVLVVYHFFPYYRLPVMRKLAGDRNVQYTFLSGFPFELSIPSITYEDAQKEPFQWRTVKNIWFFNGALLWQSRLIQECLFGNYDGIIFLGNPFFLSTWIAAFFARLTKKKVFYWAHAIVRNRLRDKLKLLFFKIAHGLLLYSNGAKQNLVNLGFDPENIFVIYNSLDYDAQLKYRQKITLEDICRRRGMLFLHPALPILFFIGRLVGRKQLGYIINASVELHRRGLPVNVLFIGDGPEKERLRDLVNKKNLGDFVTFYGECYDENEISSLIAMSDLCVSPGDVGLTAIHSLVYGTPVITHDDPLRQMPEFESIEPGVTGMLYKYGSFESLVETIYEWLSENQSVREQIRIKCYEMVDKYYNPTYQASIIESAICKVVGLNNE